MVEETKAPERQASWIDKRLQEMAKKIAAFEKKSIADVIDSELWRALPKRLQKALDKEHAELGENGGA